MLVNTEKMIECLPLSTLFSCATINTEIFFQFLSNKRPSFGAILLDKFLDGFIFLYKRWINRSINSDKHTLWVHNFLLVVLAFRFFRFFLSSLSVNMSYSTFLVWLVVVLTWFVNEHVWLLFLGLFLLDWWFLLGGFEFGFGLAFVVGGWSWHFKLWL